MLTVTLLTLVVAIFRKMSYDARRFVHAMRRILAYNAYLRYALEIFFRLWH